MSGSREFSEEADARDRLRIVSPSLPSGDWSTARWLPSNSNDAWLQGDVVLKVCWRGDRRRLHRETQIGQALPAPLCYPPVLGSGEHEGMTWGMARYIPGDYARS